MDLDLGKIIEPCNSFLAKVREIRELGSQKARESQGTLIKKVGGNPEEVSHNFAEFAVVKACLLRVN